MTKDCFSCNGLTLFVGTLKDRFGLSVKEKFWYLHSLSDPIASVGGCNNQTRRYWRLCEDCKEPRTLRLTQYKLRRGKTVNKMLRNSHCSYWTSCALYISLLVPRPYTRYTPKHLDSHSFRPRQSNRAGYLSKTLELSSLGIIKKKDVMINSSDLVQLTHRYLNGL